MAANHDETKPDPKHSLQVQLYVKMKEIKSLADEMIVANSFDAAAISSRIFELSREVKDLRNSIAHPR